MPGKGYTSVNFPIDLLNQVDKIIKDKKHGYKSRAEFIKEAIRVHIRNYINEI